MKAIVYFDGGIRENLTAIGYLAVKPGDEEKVLFSGCRGAGAGTSNIAEYRALIAALKACIENGVKEAHIFGDSQLIVKQVNGDFKVNKPELQRLRNKAVDLIAELDECTLSWIPRAENKRADALVNQVFKRKRNKCTKKQKRERQKRLRRR